MMMDTNHRLGTLEGETGTPMSRFEFCVRMLAEALMTQDDSGYDACWIVASQMLFNSAPLPYCLGIGVLKTEDHAVLFDELDRRAAGCLHDIETEQDIAGPWPMQPGSQVAAYIIDRVEHYVEVLRADLVKAWTAAGNREHPRMYLRSIVGPDRPLGGPLTEEEVWERLAAGLDFMERRYPVSSARHRPHLASPDDFTNFLRWKLADGGRQTWDLLTDYGALLILQAAPRADHHQANIAKELRKAEAAWDRKRKKAEQDTLSLAA